MNIKEAWIKAAIELVTLEIDYYSDRTKKEYSTREVERARAKNTRVYYSAYRVCIILKNDGLESLYFIPLPFFVIPRRGVWRGNWFPPSSRISHARCFFNEK